MEVNAKGQTIREYFADSGGIVQYGGCGAAAVVMVLPLPCDVAFLGGGAGYNDLTTRLTSMEVT